MFSPGVCKIDNEDKLNQDEEKGAGEAKVKLVSCGRKADLLVNSVSAGPSTHSTTAGSHPPT